MESTVLQTIITTVGTVVVTLITVVVKTKMDNNKVKAAKDKEELIQESDLEEMVLVQEWLEGFRCKYDFDRVSIYQFHNGGKFFQGKSMKKFSMTYETFAPLFEKIKRSQQNILASEYPVWISTMLKRKCFANLTSEMEPKEKHELVYMGIQQFVTVPIYCIKGALIGFIVGYNIKDIDETVEHKFASLVEESKFISGYLA
jgi:hypothetical protein